MQGHTLQDLFVFVTLPIKPPWLSNGLCAVSLTRLPLSAWEHQLEERETRFARVALRREDFDWLTLAVHHSPISAQGFTSPF